MLIKSNFTFLGSIIKITILTFSIWLIFFVFKQFDPSSRLVHPYFHEIVLYSFVVAIVVAYFSYFNIKSGGTAKYVTVILGSTTIRMIMSLIILLILLLRNPDNRLTLVVNFLIIYLFYLLFEIYSIITNLRRISKKDNNYGK